MSGEARWQEQVPAGYLVSVMKKQREAKAVSPLTFWNFIGSEPQPNGWYCSLSGQAFPSQLHLPGNASMDTSRGLLSHSNCDQINNEDGL